MKPVLINQTPALGCADEQRSLRPGLLVADTYRLGEQLGSGSMGSVWKAQHLVLGHHVAIKFLHASLEGYPQGRVRFEREGKLAARLGGACRHICRVTDFGLLASAAPYVVMELLQGEELARRLKRESMLPLPLVAEIVAQLCLALTVAHQAGVVHRDLKPANVFLCAADDGQGVFVKLLDFGVAHAPLEHGDTESTRAGVVFGTPGYTSPEQVSGEHIDGRSDLWSVAVLAYRMATGRTPFGSGTLQEMALRILTIDPPAPSSIRPELPQAFDAWMKKALAKQREQRFATAMALSESLLAVSLGSYADSHTSSEALQRASGVVRSLRRARPGDTALRTAWRSGRLVPALVVLGLLALLATWALGPSRLPAPPRVARSEPAVVRTSARPAESSKTSRTLQPGAAPLGPDARPFTPALGKGADAPQPTMRPDPAGAHAFTFGADAPQPTMQPDPTGARAFTPAADTPQPATQPDPTGARAFTPAADAPQPATQPDPAGASTPAGDPAADAPQPPARSERARASATRRSSEASKHTPAGDALEERATELWNKTDEL